jgi:hypothetical protein
VFVPIQVLFDTSVVFLVDEAAIRLAHILTELQELPRDYLRHPLVHRIYRW